LTLVTEAGQHIAQIVSNDGPGSEMIEIIARPLSKGA